MPKEPGTLNEWADYLVAQLDSFGLEMSRTEAKSILSERASTIGSNMGISKSAALRYLTTDALDALARDLAFARADEAPGGDMFSLPRDTDLPVRILLRVVAALAESTQFYGRAREAVGAEIADRRIGEAATLSSYLGLIGEEELDDAVASTKVPSALLLRVVTFLETTADAVDEHDTQGDRQVLADALRRDIEKVKGLAGPA